MPLLLNVPYAEKDEAKALGAKWNPELKKWVAPDCKTYKDFKKWIAGPEGYHKIVLLNNVYVVVGYRQCFKCRKSVPVIGFGRKDYLTMSPNRCNSYSYENKLRLMSFFEPMPERLLKFVQENYRFEKRYSKTVGGEYFASVCPNCDMLQGKFYLFNEPSMSPFYTTDVSSLTIYECPLEYDLVVEEIEEGDIETVPFDKNIVKQGDRIMPNVGK